MGSSYINHAQTGLLVLGQQFDIWQFPTLNEEAFTVTSGHFTPILTTIQSSCPAITWCLLILFSDYLFTLFTPQHILETHQRDFFYRHLCVSLLHGAQSKDWLSQRVCTVYNLLDEDSTVLFNKSNGNVFNQKLIHFTPMGSDSAVIIPRFCAKEITINVTNTHIYSNR